MSADYLRSLYSFTLGTIGDLIVKFSKHCFQHDSKSVSNLSSRCLEIVSVNLETRGNYAMNVRLGSGRREAAVRNADVIQGEQPLMIAMQMTAGVR